MAIFNPSPTPVQEEDYRSYSHPTSQMEGNKTLGVAFSGGGKVLSDTGELIKDYGKVQEFNTRESISNSQQVAAANAARDSDSQAYENYFNSSVDDPQKTLNAPNAGLSLFPASGPDKDLPTDLRSLPQLAGSMATAKLDTKVNQVLLTAEVERQAKSLRAQYPDHADYIDQVFKKNGFGNPANAKLQALQNFYLAANAGKDDEKKKAIALGDAHMDTPMIAPVIRDVMNDVPGAIDKLRNKVNEFESYRTGLTVATAKLDLDNKLSTTESKKNAETFAAGIVNAPLQSMYQDQGLNTIQKISDRVSYLNAHKNEIDPLELQRMDDTLVGMKSQVFAYGMKTLTSPVMDSSVPGPVQVPKLDAQGRQMTVAASLQGGVKEARDIMSSATAHIDDLREMVKNKDWGLAAHTVQMMDAYTDKQLSAMMADPELRDYLTGLRAAVKANPEWGQKLYEATFPDGTKKMAAWIASHKVDQVNNGTPIATYINDPAAAGYNPSYAKHIFEGINDIIAHPGTGGLTDDNGKRNAAKSFFDAANKGILKNFSEDRFEQVGKDFKFIPGRLAFFKQMSSPDVSDEMKRLGPDTWKMYKGWVEGEHDTSIFRGQLRTLGSLPQEFSRLEFGWDDKLGHFVVKPGGNDPTALIRLGRSAIPPQVRDTLAKVNEGLDSLNYIAQKDGVSPTVYTLDKLRDLNMQFDGFKNIPEKMLNAVQSSVLFPVIKQSEMKPGETPARALARKRREETSDVPLPRSRPSPEPEPAPEPKKAALPSDADFLAQQEAYLNSLKVQDRAPTDTPASIP